MRSPFPTLILAITLLSAPCHAQFIPGALAAWSFNNGNAQDDIGTHDGSPNWVTLTPDRFGNANNAYAFSGNLTHIQVPGSPLFTMADSSFSVSLWFKVINDTSTVGMDLFGWYRCGADPGCNGTDAALYLITMTGGHIGSWVRDDAAQASLITSAPDSTYDDGSWHHTVLVVDRDQDVVTQYLDEQVVDTVQLALGPLSDGAVLVPLSFGRRFRTGWGTPSNFFKGSLDDIAIYRRALTLAEVGDLHTMGNPNVGVAEVSAAIDASVRYDAVNACILLTTAATLTDVTVQVSDLQGRLLASAPLTGTNMTIATDAWPKGCYLVSVRSRSGSAASTKVVVY